MLKVKSSDINNENRTKSMISSMNIECPSFLKKLKIFSLIINVKFQFLAVFDVLTIPNSIQFVHFISLSLKKINFKY